MSEYRRPIGVLHGTSAARATEVGVAAWLAGGPAAFTAVEHITLHETGVARRVGSVGGIDPSDTHSAARPGFAGLDMRAGPHIMGVVNVTPDSFSDGGWFFDPARAIDQALALAEAGAAILDIGGESTRPGADTVPVAQEQERVLPVIEALAKAMPSGKPRLSIDTRNPQTMRAAIAAGAHIVNDVSALRHHADSASTVAALAVPVILMHMRGEPKTMQRAIAYRWAPADVYGFLAERIEAAEAAGIPRAAIAVDYGIGFGKTPDQNAALIGHTTLFHGLGVPLLAGVSRKSFIAKLSAQEPSDRRLPGSLAAGLEAVRQGAQLLRVHDVAETRQALTILQAVLTE